MCLPPLHLGELINWSKHVEQKNSPGLDQSLSWGPWNSSMTF